MNLVGRFRGRNLLLGFVELALVRLAIG